MGQDDGSGKKEYSSLPPLKEFIEQTKQVAEEARQRGFKVPQGPEREFYANVFMISSTLYDFRFDFGRRGVNKDVDHRGDITVFMSPEHLKEMTAILFRLMNEYEQNYGEIPSAYEIDATVKVKEKNQEAPSSPEKTFFN